jgi:hypothetical protein
MGLRIPPRHPAAKSMVFGSFPAQSRLLSLFGLRVGGASNGQNQALARTGSLSTVLADQASNATQMVAHSRILFYHEESR